MKKTNALPVNTVNTYLVLNSTFINLIAYLNLAHLSLGYVSLNYIIDEFEIEWRKYINGLSGVYLV